MGKLININSLIFIHIIYIEIYANENINFYKKNLGSCFHFSVDRAQVVNKLSTNSVEKIRCNRHNNGKVKNIGIQSQVVIDMI